MVKIPGVKLDPDMLYRQCISGKKLQFAIDKLQDLHSQQITQMINAGRGYEKHSETVEKASNKTDELSVDYITVCNALYYYCEELSYRFNQHGSAAPWKAKKV